MRTPTIAAASALWIASGAAFALGPSEVFEKVAPSVWAVRGLDARERPFSYGSGVVIGPGRVITNCHVLAKAKAIQVRRGNVAYDAKLEHADAERDLCTLTVADFSAPAVAMVTLSEVKIGQRVYAVGNPEKLALTLSEGLISGLRAEDPQLPPIQTTAPISPGSSGGGLFDDQARLIGITTLIVVGRARVAQNLNFAVPAEWIGEVAERAKEQLAKRHAARVTASQAASASGMAPRTESREEAWTYRLTGRGLQAGSQEVTLASMTPDEMVEQLYAEDGTPRRVVHTKGAYVAPVGGLSLFSPYFAAFEKLNPGARIPDIENRDTRTCGPGWTCSLTGRVTGNERLRLPAGEFDTIRVQIEQSWVGSSQTNDRGEAGGRTLTVWYSPEMRRAVKFSSRGEPSRYIDTTFDLELVSHKVKEK